MELWNVEVRPNLQVNKDCLVLVKPINSILKQVQGSVVMGLVMHEMDNVENCNRSFDDTIINQANETANQYATHFAMFLPSPLRHCKHPIVEAPKTRVLGNGSKSVIEFVSRDLGSLNGLE
jgi:hypothetical protein